MAIKDLAGYFEANGLYDRERLAAHCERHLVKLAASMRLPHLGILHYLDAAVYDREWTDFTLSCRGLVVDFPRRRLLAIPFFKFFSLGESLAPSVEALRALGPFEATEKLDGSLGIAFYDEASGEFRVTTKGSLDSEHGAWAGARLPEAVRDRALLGRYTLMFEIVAACFRIVVDYRERGYAEGLYLVGMRENATQRLLSCAEVSDFARERGLKTFKSHPFRSLDEVVDNVKALPYSEEGYVLRFTRADELMVKVKSPEYLRVHRFLSNLDEKSLLEILLAGKEREVLDNLGIVPEEYRGEVAATLRRFELEAESFLASCREHFERAPKADRKTFALWAQKEPPAELRPFLFRSLDGKPPAKRDVYELFYRTKRYAPPERSGFLRMREK